MPIRQAAGTLLAVSLTIRDTLPNQNNQDFIWYTLTSANRSALKEMILGTMIDSNKPIRRAAANVRLILFRLLQQFAALNYHEINGLELPRK